MTDHRDVMSRSLGAAPSRGGTASPWFSRFQERPQARVRLFCFPYAGAGASLFREWANELPPDIEVVAIQPPGREARFAEPPTTDIGLLAREVCDAIAPLLDRPFALFGHSLGAIVAWETALRLERHHDASPVALFVSSREAPGAPQTYAPIYALDDDAFLKELGRLNGIPGEVLANRELCALLLPILRADMQIADTYTGSPGDRVRAPIIALSARDDAHVTLDAMEPWRERTTGDSRMMIVPGDHFYLHGQRALLLRVIATRLQRR